MSFPATSAVVLCPVPSWQLPHWADDHHSFIRQTIFRVCFAPGPAAHRLEVGGGEGRGSKAAKEANVAGASRSPRTCSEMLRELGREARGGQRGERSVPGWTKAEALGGARNRTGLTHHRSGRVTRARQGWPESRQRRKS